MRTIVLATQKGGSGKSTLAIGLALAAQQAGHHVRLIDTDPQATLSNWQCRRGLAEPLVETIREADAIEHRLPALDRGGVTLAIIDTASGVTAATKAAIGCADVCLIPARPSVADIEATKPTLRIVRAWKRRFAFVLNQTPIRGNRIAIAAATLGGDASRDIVDILAQPFIAMRNDHQDALAAGLAVSEYDPRGKASEEIRDLWHWVDARLAGAIPAGGDICDLQQVRAMPAARFADLAARTPAMLSLSTWGDAGAPWDACL
jgi:chromosome partitioning protein